MDLPLQALAAANFDSVKRLAEVWKNDPSDIPALNERVRQRLFREVDALMDGSGQSSPLGLVLTGAGGVGKTHLLSILRQHTNAKGGYFVMVNMTGANDFWPALLRGMVESLHCPDANGHPQHLSLSDAIIRESGGRGFPDGIDAYFREDLRHLVRKVLDDLHGRHTWEVGAYADTIRAVLLLASGDRGVSDCCRRWLQGKPLANEEGRTFGFDNNQAEPQNAAAGLSWLFALGGNGTVIALDQLDALAERRLALAGLGSASEASHAAGRIIAETAEGLSALIDLTRRTLVVVSCLASTWSAFNQFSFRPFLERFDAAIPLLPVREPDQARALVAARMQAAAAAVGYQPPYPTWPFRPEAFADIQLFPRYILQLCRRHIQRCLAENRVEETDCLTDGFHDKDKGEGTKAEKPATAGEVEEAGDVAEAAAEAISPSAATHDDADAEPVEVMAEIPPAQETHPLTARYLQLRAEVRPGDARDKSREDEFWLPALAAFARAVAAEPAAHVPGRSLDVTVSGNLDHGSAPRFHVLLRRRQGEGNGGERRLYLRAILQDSILAFRTRLKEFMEEPETAPTAATCRHVVLFPEKRPPLGKTRPRYRKDFEREGALVFPKDEEIRSLAALAALEREGPEAWMEWLGEYRPLREIRFLDQELAWLFGENGER